MEEAVVDQHNHRQGVIDLPPGFRFHPTDEEIITHYLTEKVMNTSFSACAIGEVDLNKSEPWDLPSKAKMGEKEFYFFCQRDRKYPTGMRTNRATEAGYWKATGKDKEIYKGNKGGVGGGGLVGMKKTLVFYKGRAPKGEKTNWVMHEYRLEGKFSYYNLPKAAKDEWVVCRVFHKNIGGGIKKIPIPGLPMNSSFGDDFFANYASLPPLMDPPGSSSFGNGGHQNEFKPMNTASTSSRSYNIPADNQNFLQPHQIPIQNQIFSYHQNNNNPNPGYLHQGTIRSSTGAISSLMGAGFEGNGDDQAILRALASTSHHHQQHNLESSSHCKVEQFSSNQSMISRSQDTGLSTDMNTTTEISSVVSKQDNKSYDQDLDATSIAELDSFWDY